MSNDANQKLSGPELISYCEVCGLELTDDEREGRIGHDCPPGFQA